MKARLAFLAAALAGAALAPGDAAAAAEPRSAIPWLSQSLREPEPPPRPLARPPLRAPVPEDEGAIAVTPLDGISLDAVGILPPDETGFARALWGPASALRVRNLILGHAGGGVPEARALFKRILLAEADPPAGAGASAQVLVARIDRLLAMGALLEAEALIEQAGAETPELFRRMFDVGLLLDRAEPACEALRRNPQLSPTLPARIFCLARDGDWNAAEITLTLGANMGELGGEEELALARFLDPELFEHLAPPEPPEPFTPLDFLLREAVGLPRPATLPVAFLHHDLAEYLPMRARVQAAERLVIEGAVAPEVLIDAYRAGRPAASGGFWDRAAAVQALDAALAGGDAGAVAAALVEADAALAPRGLRVALARGYAEALAAVDARALAPDARGILVELLLLGDAYVGAADAASEAEPDPRTELLLAIAGQRRRVPPAAAGATPLERAALAGMIGRRPPDERAGRLLALIEDGREGEMLLAALELVAEGPAADPTSLRAALFALRRAGQEPSARRIALQTLLAAPPGRSP